MKPMIRICIGTLEKNEGVTKPDGTFHITGLGARQYSVLLDMVRDLFRGFNRTYHLTPIASECGERIANNQSDFSTDGCDIYEMVPRFRQGIPVSPEKVEFISGFLITGGHEYSKDVATVFMNADLLQPEVYCCASILVVSLFLFVAVRIFMIYSMRDGPWAPHGRRIVTPGYIIRREMSRVFYYSSTNFKLTTLIFGIFMFYLVTSFLCLYKVSQIVVEEPFFPHNYQQSLEYKSSLAFFFDKFIAISSRFRDASPRSVHNKLWKKLINSGHENDFQVSNISVDRAVEILQQDLWTAIGADKSIFLGSSVFIKFLFKLACSTSPEGKLAHIRVLSDPLEEEMLQGFILSKFYPFPLVFDQRNRRLSEGLIMIHLRTLGFDFGGLINQFFTRSKSHRWKQKTLCDDPKAYEPEIEVKPIQLDYFASFFTACALIWSFAFLINKAQIAFNLIRPRKM